MAKLTAPLLALSARGTIADTLTYSAWKGIDYVRQRVIPANPQTAAQDLTREVFRVLSQMWVQMQTLARAPWIASAVGKAFTHRNSLIHTNLSPMRSEVDMDAFIGSPGALAGMAPASISAIFGAGSISVTIGAPTLPPDWTIDAGVAFAFPDQDPHDNFVGPVKEAEDLVTPYVAVIAGCAAPLGTWQATGFFRYLRPDGRTAYGPALTTQVQVV